ncbi:hypothetical protein [Pedobacter sp. Leaf176]|uniref:hypothetical protein n=1 Tax=Pedobacter sp. Leaf176 TaxID=1736286 RepID=UPI0006F5B709|nr:hypothetical protein [Pedobacter sp. Leaf176]KQR70404.1 hypothetical protein ASF92_10505 [Pedobacter sp. Leaf176]
MAQKNNNSADTDDAQEKQNQKALGNTDVSSTTGADELKSTPKITGTGSNPPAAAPESLIVHEDEDDENRYENHKPGN